MFNAEVIETIQKKYKTFLPYLDERSLRLDSIPKGQAKTALVLHRGGVIGGWGNWQAIGVSQLLG